ncbi:hypothetical protein [Burkholderia pseudomallei]|uniref:hypothetical protein n=1 Tax=Burkholderia pseudomallei TaxID=28450 RepID=UPI000316F4A3|nr:hypothetical protein [Burkholderia pseudomallei]KGS43598.1 hypothetical protein X992_4061 [Burkholderia pseudomallei MSHR5492]KGC97726.1 hypothetical protein DO63_5581 [Burkholderia pseudomallei]KGS49508.1 hypothetical protein X961_3260 [Burkholderia pseudomallei MSHR5613]MBF3554781.1 hypothetical protein [Burkholderia pseudomallei]MDV2086015.1 hypothetical protein [Burkholderia pseudomallei]
MRFEHGRNAAARIKAKRVGFTGSNRDRIEKKQKRPIRAAWTRAGESAHGANEDEKNGHA